MTNTGLTKELIDTGYKGGHGSIRDAAMISVNASRGLDLYRKPVEREVDAEREVESRSGISGRQYSPGAWTEYAKPKK